MNAKLTLTLDQELIAAVKDYAKSSNLSVSTIIGRYLRSLLDEKQNQEKDHLSWADELPGITHFDQEFDLRDYTNYLIDWYQ